MSEIAWIFAQAKPAAGAASLLGSPIVFMLLVFVLFYFMLIRPERKKQKDHQEMLNHLVRGDKIITSSGIYGEIDFISATEATIEIAPKVKIRIQRQAISGKELPKTEKAKSEEPAKKV